MEKIIWSGDAALSIADRLRTASTALERSADGCRSCRARLWTALPELDTSLSEQLFAALDGTLRLLEAVSERADRLAAATVAANERFLDADQTTKRQYEAIFRSVTSADSFLRQSAAGTLSVRIAHVQENEGILTPEWLRRAALRYFSPAPAQQSH